MAAGAATHESEPIDKSVNDSSSKDNKTKPQLFQSVSRNSVTFFSGENAIKVAKQKLQALKEIAFKNESTERGEEKQHQKNDEEDKNSFEKKLVNIVLNHV